MNILVVIIVLYLKEKRPRNKKNVAKNVNSQNVNGMIAPVSSVSTSYAGAWPRVAVQKQSQPASVETSTSHTEPLLTYEQFLSLHQARMSTSDQQSSSSVANTCHPIHMGGKTSSNTSGTRYMGSSRATAGHLGSPQAMKDQIYGDLG